MNSHNHAIESPIKEDPTTSERTDVILKNGIYCAENNDDWLNAYKIRLKVRETEKSYIFELVELDSRYSADLMKMLFKDKKRVLVHKNKGGHAIRVWSDHDFTFYPLQAGIPFWFMLEEDKETV